MTLALPVALIALAMASWTGGGEVPLSAVAVSSHVRTHDAGQTK